MKTEHQSVDARNNSGLPAQSADRIRTNNLSEIKFFLESLILAQDERWRRA
ncbi:hypothetical protein [Ureibacillus terrenus]|uniref:hypothetical protein n=1 Tax=Ureibacillus terrenus TaxID=118246 RepID=UPI002E23F801|nr:hypothetical protein [Ureibacillus terrenus]